VVLIDEIDKAARDFPNDLLARTRPAQLPAPLRRPSSGSRRAAGRRPVVIVTSNDERRLPDAFLRRCIFHRIELERKARRRPPSRAWPAPTAAVSRISTPPPAPPPAGVSWQLRAVQGLDKKPSTAELLTWLCILSAQRIDAQRPWMAATLGEFARPRRA
jgi:MoxR-like ATPase